MITSSISDLGLYLLLHPLRPVSACKSKDLDHYSHNLFPSIVRCFASQRPLLTDSTLGSTFRSTILAWRVFAIPKTWIITHIVCPHWQPGVSHRNDHFSRIRPWAAPPGPPSLSGECLRLRKHESLFADPFFINSQVSCIVITTSHFFTAPWYLQHAGHPLHPLPPFVLKSKMCFTMLKGQ